MCNDVYFVTLAAALRLAAFDANALSFLSILYMNLFFMKPTLFSLADHNTTGSSFEACRRFVCALCVLRISHVTLAGCFFSVRSFFFVINSNSFVNIIEKSEGQGLDLDGR